MNQGRSKQRKYVLGGIAWSVAVAGLCAAAQTAGQPTGAVTSVVIGVDKPGATIASTMFGIFFEDINFAADGGLYPERIKNRSFEFPDALMGWKRAAVDLDRARGTYVIATDASASAQNPHYLRITNKAGSFGVTNDGFRGIGIRKGERYRFSMLARLASDAPVTARVELENPSSRPLGGLTFEGFTREWKRYSGAMVSEGEDNSRARLRVVLQTPGALDVDMISLFPEDTWAGRENGLRKDLVQLLKDMHPGFLRFPGGCIVEGRFLDGRYQWKTTIGDPADRKLIINRWNDEFGNRAAPDYYQSFGLGFYEYFQLAEDIGAEPLPVLNCGMACQFNSNELAPLDEIGPYIQDALDLIEFANGPVTSAWGKKRADMGHPATFNLKMLAVGNEQWGPQYIERYELFAKILKEKHPEIKLSSSAGPFASGQQFDFLWSKIRAMDPKLVDLVDEHYYQPPTWFFTNVNRYDNYPRTGPKIFAGEFAAHAATIPARGQRPSTLATALAEAAFMTGLERNADIVELASFAPLFAHVDAWQWTPNLIWFDNLRSFGTPSYYVQKLFGANRGTRVLPVTIDGATKNGQSQNDLFTSASLDPATHEVIVKLVNPSTLPRVVKLDLGTYAKPGPARALVLTGDPNGENSLQAPTMVLPSERTLELGATSGPMEHTLPANSLTVLRLPVK